MRKLTVSFGEQHPAKISSTEELTWPELITELTLKPPIEADKAARGWYCPAEFAPEYRDSKNLIARHALTLDYDHVKPDEVRRILRAFRNYEYLTYTTASHTAVAPRFRVVLPLNRPAMMDEFCAVSRWIAEPAGIELASRESHVPAQMMYLPTIKLGTEFKHKLHEGEWIDVDETLGCYEDWTDRSSWPHRKDADSTHSGEKGIPPDEKPGIVGDFCRAFNIYQAIEHFDLPYKPSGAADRFTYKEGSRPEGVIIYDGGRKLHSHHDTDPARGQHNSFDLVRLHRYSQLDVDTPAETQNTDRPSFVAMVESTTNDPYISHAIGTAGFDILPELPIQSKPESEPESDDAAGLARHVSVVLTHHTVPRWLIKDHIERGVIAVMAGKRGSYKSFLALDWACKTAMSNLPAYVISAEGGDMDRRVRAWLSVFGKGKDPKDIPLYIVERRLNLAKHDNIELIRQDCKTLNISPVLFVLDTFSKLSGGLDENDNTAVKQFIGSLDTGFKRKDSAFDATVLLVAHTGHGDKGRPRGASAMGADTDAEYIVRRDDVSASMEVTRERFKSSPELPPLYFKSEVVPLLYTDETGESVTSLILREAVSVKRRSKTEPTGPVNQIAWGVAKKLLCDGGVKTVSRFLTEVTEQIPKDSEGRDRGRQKAIRALDSLVAGGFIYLPTSDTVSLTTATLIDTDAWLQMEEDAK